VFAVPFKKKAANPCRSLGIHKALIHNGEGRGGRGALSRKTTRSKGEALLFQPAGGDRTFLIQKERVYRKREGGNGKGHHWGHKANRRQEGDPTFLRRNSWNGKEKETYLPQGAA